MPLIPGGSSSSRVRANQPRKIQIRQAKQLHCHARNTPLPGVAASSKETDHVLVYKTLDKADSGVHLATSRRSFSNTHPIGAFVGALRPPGLEPAAYLVGWGGSDWKPCVLAAAKAWRRCFRGRKR